MPRPCKSTLLTRLDEAIAGLIRDLADAVRPGPEPDPIPVRIEERR